MAKYCYFETLRQNDNGYLVDGCYACHRTVGYKLTPQGDIEDRERYRWDHIRDLCQPGGPTGHVFYEIYGHEPVKAVEAHVKKQETIKRNKADMDGAFEEAKKWVTSSTTSMAKGL